MDATFLPFASRKREPQEETTGFNKIIAKKEFQEINRLVVMCGSAKRKPPKSTADHQIEENSRECEGFAGNKESHREDFSNLRIPHLKKISGKGISFATKTCRDLFDLLKPYRELKKVKDSTRDFKKISAKNCFIQGGIKATRKLQILNITQEETPADSPPFSTECDFLSSLECCNANPQNVELNFLNFTIAKKAKTFSNSSPPVKFGLNPDFGSNNNKTLSSEDFIKRVFSAAEEALIEVNDKSRSEESTKF